jgi:hypothetical protein
VIRFDYEITLLTVRAKRASGEIETVFCDPIGHRQIKGDYVESWQPHPMSAAALDKSREIARAVTGNLGGRGIFGVELFVSDDVWFSEMSPRPHGTGMVTMIGTEQFGARDSRPAVDVRARVRNQRRDLRRTGCDGIAFEGVAGRLRFQPDLRLFSGGRLRACWAWRWPPPLSAP